MKDPEPSALHNVPLPEEEQTGAHRHPLHQYAVEQSCVTPSESRIRNSSVSSNVSQTRPIVVVKHRRILLAVASERVIFALSPIIRALDAAVVQVVEGTALEQALRERGRFDLVLCDSHLPGGTGLGILAGQRRSGHTTPFVIVQSIHEHLVRVVVGGGSGGVLSTRVVSELALIELVEGLLEVQEPPTSSHRNPPRFAKGR